MNPIVSVLLEKEPEFSDLVEVFVKRLPPIVSKIRQLFQEKAWLQLKKEVHELKGMGGGFGYPMLTELAGRIEYQIKNQNHDEVGILLEELDALSDRIVKGMPTAQHQQCA
ncbi:MAG: Hpt domain-containing protein [Gammaproteobacteria bacterium]|jgi:HPt (histidine-containing phosphotransfer) domain-containing protein|nr:Hpt domain-containing protein [Gammaproteobacteria bacterium]